MSGRQLLALGAVVLALLGVVWYVVVTPSKGASVEPGAATNVEIAATATGTGNWVRYLLSVRNVGDQTFHGDVLLIDNQDQTGSIGTPAPAPAPAPSLSRVPRLPTPPEVAAQPAYRAHLTVPGRTTRTIAVTAPDSFNYAQVLSGSQVLADSSVEKSVMLPIAVLSDVETAARAIGGLQFDRITPRVADFASTRGFPASPLQLATYAAVVLDQVDTAALSGAQVQALRDFVGLGGTLLVTGGADWRRTLAPLPADLLPMTAQSTATVSLQPLAQLAGAAPGELSAPAAAGALRPGARELLASDGATLAAQLEYGAGRIVELAFGPAASPVAGSPYAALAWKEGLARGLANVPGSNPAGPTVLPPDPQFTAFLPTAGDAPLPAPALVGAVLFLYVLVAAPLNYLLVYRRLRRPTLMWLTAPAIAVLFTTIFYAVGTDLQGSVQDHEIQVVKVGQGQTVNTLEYHRVLFLRRGNHEVVPAPDTLVAPLTLDTYRTTGSTCERCTTQLQGLAAGMEDVLPGAKPVVREAGVVYGSVRVIASSGIAHIPAGVGAQLSVRGGHLVGTVTNRSGSPVQALTLFASDGETMQRADVLARLPAGATAQVDAPIQADTSSQQSSAISVLRSVALAGIAAGNGSVLTGFTAAAPSALKVDGARPQITSLAVLQQPVQVEAADGLLRYFETRQLASSNGESGTGFQDAYDITVPRTSAPLSLKYNIDLSAEMEVYDFSLGRFVKVTPAPGNVQASVGLSSTQMSAGLVRVRFREARLFQGSAVSLDTP
jgi:hypothetical protein